tara:strand:+ start:479 stop:3526 length:3048 start_codon:yes stop_codon:yes gene_type:complete
MHRILFFKICLWLVALTFTSAGWAQRPSETPQGLQSGLTYHYYTGSFTVLPDFTSLTPVSMGNATSIDVSYREQDDDFALTFNGYIEVPTTGTYTFYLSSDDGSRLWIGDQLVVDNDGLHGVEEESNTIDLEAGFHPVTIHFFEHLGGHVLIAEYAGPGISRQIIPSSVLFHDLPVLPGLVYRTYTGIWEYLPDFASMTPITTGIATAPNTSYAQTEDYFGLTFDGYIDVPVAGNYTLFLNSDDGSRLWIGDQLVVDNDGLHGALEVSGSINLQKGLNPITIHFFERGGDQILDVQYMGPGISKQAVPSTSWHRDDDSVQLYDNDAYLVPLAQAANLQTLLDTHDIIRLESGDYSVSGPAELVLSSNQKIYGMPGTIISKLTVPGGTKNSFVSYLRANNGLYFAPSSLPVTGNEFRAFNNTHIKVDNATLQNNLFVGFMLTRVHIDNTQGGYLRNNRFVRFTVHAWDQQLVMNGNTVSGFESYGNVFLWFNFLTSNTYVTQIDNQQELTLVGTDSESWNWSGNDNRALFSTGDMQTLRLFACQGGSSLPSNQWTQLLNTNAQEVFVIGMDVNPYSLLSPNITFQSGNQRSLQLQSQVYSVESLNANADRITGMIGNVNHFDINGIAQASQMSSYDADLLDGMIRPTSRPGEQWEAPTYMNIPDPGGPIWNFNLASKPDDTTYLQNRIDTEGIVHLEPGIYYISAPLTIRREYGLIGSGMGNTLIIAKTNDFDMIRIKNDDLSRSQNFTLCNLTLQGGRNGLVTDINNHQYNSINFSYVQFRDMVENGVYIHDIYTWDNNLIDHVFFVNCAIGVKQIGDTSFDGTSSPTETFMDKNFWYRCQFVDCGLPLDLQAYRANNLNMYMECLFENSTTRAADFTNNLTTIFANCDLINNAGSPTIQTNTSTVYVSCRFTAGQANTGFIKPQSLVEGCSFDANGLSNVTVIAGNDPWSKSVLINSQTTNGATLGTVSEGLLLNTSINGLTNRVIRYIGGNTYSLDNRDAIPVPMLLWGQTFR